MKMIHLAAIAALALGLGAGTSLAASAPGTIGNPSGAFAPAPSGSRCDDVQKNPGNYSTVDQDFCSGQTNGDNRQYEHGQSAARQQQRPQWREWLTQRTTSGRRAPPPTLVAGG